MNIHREYGEHCARVKLGFEDSGSGITPYLPYLAGLGAAGIAGPLLYKHLRTVEPSTSKAVNAMRAKANDTFTRIIPEKPARTRIGEWWDRLTHTGGDPIIYSDLPRAPRGKGKKIPGMVRYWEPAEQRFVHGDVAVGGAPEHDELMKLIADDKWEEFKFWNEHAPGSLGRSENIADVLRNLGHDPVAPRSKEQEQRLLYQLREHLKQQYPQGFLLKETGGLQSGGIFPSEKTKFNTMLTRYRHSGLAEKQEKGLKNLKRDYDGDIGKLIAEIGDHPAYEGRVLHQLVQDPSKVIVQEKLPLLRTANTPHELISKVTRFKPNLETRVHVEGGIAYPELTSARYDPTLSVVGNDTLEGATAYAQSLIDKLPDKYKNLSWAMDIAPVEGGGFRLLESNPGGQSGFLDPTVLPTSGIHLRKALLGNYAKPISAIGAGLGAAGAGAAAGLGTAAMLPYVSGPSNHLPSRASTQLQQKNQGVR